MTLMYVWVTFEGLAIKTTHFTRINMVRYINASQVCTILQHKLLYIAGSRTLDVFILIVVWI